MSPWRQQLLQGSFRGVPFYTRKSDSEHGRRTVTHEYPLRDVPYVEELGLKGRAFTLDAYVIGTDYMPWRDRLIAALEQAGPGELIHPYRGILNVALTAPAHVSESADEGGMARFSLTFTQVDNNTQPLFRPDTPSLVSTAADSANSALNADFAKSFNVASMADFVSVNAESVVNTALSAITQISSFSRTGPLADLMSSATSISSSLSILMRTPQMLADGIQGQLYGLAALVNTPLDAYRDLQSLFGDAATPISVPNIPVTTPSRIQQSINQTAVLDLVRRTAIVETARASSQIAFVSYNDAQATLSILVNALDNELSSNKILASGQAVPLNDDVYDALLELRVAVVRDISTRGANLAKLTTITLPRTLPALVAAYRIYGDCTMDADVIARNNIRHPGFVPGGTVLEILA